MLEDHRRGRRRSVRGETDNARLFEKWGSAGKNLRLMTSIPIEKPGTLKGVAGQPVPNAA